MNIILLLQYVLSIAVVAIVTFLLARLKKTLRRSLKKPPSQP